jgi:hypothetical protein
MEEFLGREDRNNEDIGSEGASCSHWQNIGYVMKENLGSYAIHSFNPISSNTDITRHIDVFIVHTACFHF